MEKNEAYKDDDEADDYLCDNDPYNSQNEYAGGASNVKLQTGFVIAEAAPAPVIEWVKPNEKIELITGIDDSPTLQATAREWAPSQAALAAAAAAVVGGLVSNETKTVDDTNPARTELIVTDIHDDDDVPVRLYLYNNRFIFVKVLTIF
jgi:hypothetical protein